MFLGIVLITMTYIGFLIRKEDVKYWCNIKEGWRCLLEFGVLMTAFTMILVVLLALFPVIPVSIAMWIPPLISIVWVAIRSTKRDCLRDGQLIIADQYFTHLPKYQYGYLGEMDKKQLGRYKTFRVEKMVEYYKELNRGKIK